MHIPTLSLSHTHPSPQGDPDSLSLSHTHPSPQVRARVDKTVQDIYAKDDSPEAFAKQGVEVISGNARFKDRSTLIIENANGDTQLISAKSGIIIGTGAVPNLPALSGLDSVDYITYEQVFSLQSLPKKMTIVGGGPIGCELAQAFVRLGSQVGGGGVRGGGGGGWGGGLGGGG